MTMNVSSPGKAPSRSKCRSEVVLYGESVAEAQTRCEQIQSERRLTLVHPYDDERIIAGQGTIALEMQIGSRALRRECRGGANTLRADPERAQADAGSPL